MSDFKFACPVCGQHITADSSSSGTRLECPTCFRKIVVPQAPTTGESKFILSAAQADKPRPNAGTDTGLGLQTEAAHRPLPMVVVAVVALCLAGAGVWFWHIRSQRAAARRAAAAAAAAAAAKRSPAPRTVYPIPTNIVWTLELSNAVIPEANAAGSIHGNGFSCERSTLQGGNLGLRQGATWPPDLGLNIHLVAQQGEELSGKTIVIPPDRPKVPRVMLRWKDDQNQPRTEDFHSGYALRLVFGQAANGRMPGQLFLGLPDESKSVVAGSFNAEIRRPPPPKPKAPPKNPPPVASQPTSPP